VYYVSRWLKGIKRGQHKGSDMVVWNFKDVTLKTKSEIKMEKGKLFWKACSRASKLRRRADKNVFFFRSRNWANKWPVSASRLHPFSSSFNSSPIQPVSKTCARNLSSEIKMEGNKNIYLHLSVTCTIRKLSP